MAVQSGRCMGFHKNSSGNLICPLTQASGFISFQAKQPEILAQLSDNFLPTGAIACSLILVCGGSI